VSCSPSQPNRTLTRTSVLQSVPTKQDTNTDKCLAVRPNHGLSVCIKKQPLDLKHPTKPQFAPPLLQPRTVDEVGHRILQQRLPWSVSRLRCAPLLEKHILSLRASNSHYEAHFRFCAVQTALFIINWYNEWQRQCCIWRGLWRSTKVLPRRSLQIVTPFDSTLVN
jgi:hypothetical protein